MKKRRKRHTRSRLFAMAMIAALLAPNLPVSRIYADGTEQEKVTVAFSSEAQDGTEVITIEAETLADTIEITGISLPDKSFIEQKEAEYTVKENDTYEFEVFYRETVIVEKEQVDPEVTVPGELPIEDETTAEDETRTDDSFKEEETPAVEETAAEAESSGEAESSEETETSEEAESSEAAETSEAAEAAESSASAESSEAAEASTALEKKASPKALIPDALAAKAGDFGGVQSEALEVTIVEGSKTFTFQATKAEKLQESNPDWFEFEESTGTIIKYKGPNKVPSVVIPSQINNTPVTAIGFEAFISQENIGEITISEGVTSIGNRAFMSAKSLKSITIPESVTTIGYQAFAWCYSLKDITIPEGVTTINASTFSECFELTNVTLPESLTSIGAYSFFRCYALKNITIPEGVTSIGESAFYNATGLRSINIPEGVTRIEEGTFSLCFSLTSVTIPENVTSIDIWAFLYTKSLKDIFVNRCYEDAPESMTNTIPWGSSPDITEIHWLASTPNYEVSFQDWDGMELAKRTVKEGDSAIAPAAPLRSGYTFIGWDTDFQKVISNLTVKAQYAQNPVDPPVNPPVDPPVNPPVDPPVNPPVDPPVNPPVDPPVNPPVDPPVNPPVDPPVNPPVDPPVNPPAERPNRPVAPPEKPPVNPPVDPPVELPTMTDVSTPQPLIPPEELPAIVTPPPAIAVQNTGEAAEEINALVIPPTQEDGGNIGIEITASNKETEITRQDLSTTDRPEFGIQNEAHRCILHWLLFLTAALFTAYGVITKKKNDREIINRAN